METLNKNWFAFTLIAVIFGLLGFILGKQGAGSHYQSCPAMPMMLMIHYEKYDGNGSSYLWS